MDALTLLVLSKAQPRAKVRDNRERYRILCMSHLVPANAEHFDVIDKPGPQGHCMVCGRALRRPRLNSV